MMPVVILLASNHHCNNAGACAFYLANAFPAYTVRLFNYRNNHIYTYNLVLRAFTDNGKLVPNDLFYDTVRLGMHAGADNGADVSAQCFMRLAKMTRYADSVTTFDPGNIPADFLSRAIQVLSALLLLPDPHKCFVVAPNGRNIPSRFLTFGHKLRHGPVNYQYRSRGAGMVPATNVLKMTNEQVVATIMELCLCRAIIANPAARYLGNCYGAQIMWVALGGGLTTFKRNAGPNGANHIWAYSPNNNAEVSWNDGVYLGDAPNTLHAEATVSSFALFGVHGPNISYNTDFHHSYMMISTKATVNLGLTQIEHDLQVGVAGIALGGGAQPHMRRVQRYARDAATKWAGGAKAAREWSWIGIYRYQGRITGFQGHPLYHLTPHSAAWNAVAPTVAAGAGAAPNNHHAATRTMVDQCLF